MVPDNVNTNGNGAAAPTTDRRVPLPCSPETEFPPIEEAQLLTAARYLRDHAPEVLSVIVARDPWGVHPRRALLLRLRAAVGRTVRAAHKAETAAARAAWESAK